MAHRAVVPGLHSNPSSSGSVTLSFDISNDVICVQASAVVHLHSNGGVRNGCLELSDFLGAAARFSVICARSVSLQISTVWRQGDVVFSMCHGFRLTAENPKRDFLA